MSRSSIVTNKDIVKKVAEKTGASYEQVDYILKFITIHIKSVMHNPFYLSIKLPWIGYMYLKVGFLKKLRILKSMSEELAPGQSKKLLASIKRENLIKKLGVGRAERRHLKKTIIYDKSYTSLLTVEELENYQNTNWK